MVVSTLFLFWIGDGWCYMETWRPVGDRVTGRTILGYWGGTLQGVVKQGRDISPWSSTPLDPPLPSPLPLPLPSFSFSPSLFVRGNQVLVDLSCGPDTNERYYYSECVSGFHLLTPGRDSYLSPTVDVRSEPRGPRQNVCN